MRFRIATLLYLFALIAVCIRIFGAAGLLVAALVPGCWWWARERNLRWIALALVLFALATLLSLRALAATFPRPYNSVYQNVDRNRVKLLAIAIISYEIQNGRLPPYTTDADGRPLHSWRTLILPFLNEEILYSKLTLDEPWDSPTNLAVFQSAKTDAFASELYRVAYGVPESEAHFLAVTGGGTLWSPNRQESSTPTYDAARDRVMLVQTGVKRARWYEPVDLSEEEFVHLLHGDDNDELDTVEVGYFVTRYGRIHRRRTRTVGLGGGVVFDVQRAPTRDVARSLVVVSDDPIELWSVAEEYVSDTDAEVRLVRVQLHWGRVWNALVFVALALLPARWALRKRADA